MMDGFIHFPANAPALSALGLLYAENFDEPPPPAPPEPVPEPPPRALPLISQEDVEQACHRAVQQAQAEWAQSAQRRREDALCALRAGLAELRADAAAQAGRVAEATARACLAAVTAVLPALCARHGDHEVRAMLRNVLPMLAACGPIVVRVHPGLIEALRQDLAAFDDPLDVELRPANLPHGDARLSWPDGSLLRDTAAIRAGIEGTLAQLGLLPSPDRSPDDVHAPDADPAPRPALALAHADV